jgi:WD40 repeat protein
VLDSFARHASRVQALAFDRTGTWLASGDRDGIIRLWESGSARALSTIREPAYQAAATLAIDWPHGLIAAGGGNGGLRVWDVNVPDAPELLAELPWAAVTTALAFDEAGDRLAAGGADGSVAVWDLERAAENSPDVRHVHSDKVLAVAWDDQQHGWISVGADGSVGPLRAAAVAPAARRGAVIDHSSGRMYVFRADAPGDTRPLAGTDLALTGISFARGDELLVMSGSDGTLQVWETRSPVLRTVRAVGCPITALCGSRDGMRLAACDEDGRVIIYSATGRSIVEQSARQGPDRVSAAAFRPDGARLVTAGDAVQVWNATDGTPGRALPDGTRRARDVCYHPAGRRLAAAGSDGVVMVWDGATLLCALTGHKGPVQAVAFGPADGQLVTAGDDETIRIWDLNRRDELRVLSGLGYRGTALAVNPADGTLAVGCGDGTVRLVTPPHWSDAPALVGHVHSITALSFTPDGQGLATASRDGTVRVWDLRTRSLETVLVPGVPGWAGVAALQDGSFRGYGAADGRIWYALGLTRQSLADGRSAANGALPTVTLPTRSGESDG